MLDVSLCTHQVEDREGDPFDHKRASRQPEGERQGGDSQGDQQEEGGRAEDQGRPEGCRAEDHSKQGACISGVASCQADAQDVLRRVPPLEKRQLLC